MRPAFPLVFAAVLVAGCGAPRRGPGATSDTAAVAPLPDTARDSLADSAAGKPDSLVALAPAVPVLRSDSARGDAIYHGRGRCFACHGQQGAGLAGLGPDLADSTWLAGDGSVGAIAQVVARGVADPVTVTAPMPAFRDVLDSATIARVAVYVYTLSHPGMTRSDSALAAARAMAADSAAADSATRERAVPDSATAQPVAP